ncbi:MAG: OsmC family protein [Flavobacterium sp.]|nr:OsmC family protein [Flavobacterium sp.]
MKRNATAVWEGSLKEGAGKISLESKTLENAQYSFKTRFEQGNGTNPEELIAAAHAGCFTMQLTAYIGEEGYEVESIETKCDIDFQDGSIVGSHLTLSAKIKGITDEKFQELVTKAETKCPVSRLLNTKITSEATLA